jgi:hypothetical protein
MSLNLGVLQVRIVQRQIPRVNRTNLVGPVADLKANSDKSDRGPD